MPRLKKKWTHGEKPVPIVTQSAQVDREFMRIKTAADYFDVTVWTIRGLIEKRLIAAKKIGKYLVIRRSDLEGYWDKSKTAA